jgi:hypothetical protein
MIEVDVAAETTPEPCPAPCGDYGPIQVEMHDTLGVIALALVSLLLLRALRKEQATNRALEQWLMQQGEVD